jgi:plastocyanin
MRKSFALLSTSLAVALPLTGCGGDDEEEPDRATGDREESPAAGRETEAGKGKTFRLRMNDAEQFSPARLTIPAGAKVVWANVGDKRHTVTKETGSSRDFDSGDVDGGDTYSFTFTRPGQTTYLCEHHFQMTGIITVK